MAWELTNQFRVWLVDFVGIEMPQVIASAGGTAANMSGAIPKMYFLVGMLYQTFSLEFRPRQDKIALIPVLAWKGQLPKQLTTVRVNRKYKLKLNHRTKENNIADAIALGDWYLARANPPN